nr:hypothetical protein [Neisseria meningitidis]
MPKQKIIAFSLTGGRNPRIAKTQPENLHFFAKKKKKKKKKKNFFFLKKKKKKKKKNKLTL